MVNSDIPLLLSLESMKKAKVKLDLENDSAEIFGNEVLLSYTSLGHYRMSTDRVKVQVKLLGGVYLSKVK